MSGGRGRLSISTQRLLNQAVWDTVAAMSQVRRFVAAGLDTVAYRGRRRGLVIATLDETGQPKQGVATCGVKRQYMARLGVDRHRIAPPSSAGPPSPAQR